MTAKKKQSGDGKGVALEIKRKRGRPFEKGNKIGHRFKPGESGNPGGRPKSDISPTRILEELARLAFLDPRKLFDEQGSLVPINKLDEETAAAIAGLDHDEIYAGRGEERASIGRTAKIKLIQKTQALELLGKYHKLFVDRIEHNADDELVAALLEGRKRVRDARSDG